MKFVVLMWDPGRDYDTPQPFYPILSHLNLLHPFIPYLTQIHYSSIYSLVSQVVFPFSLGTRWRWVVSFTPLPLYHQGKISWYPLDRRLGGPQSRSGRGGEEKNSQCLQGLELPIIQPAVQHYTAELSWLPTLTCTKRIKLLENLSYSFIEHTGR
jgi:hypothetical protein